MAEITASLVKELRDLTGAGMMECKKALTEAEGQVEKAVDVLRTRGLAAVAKKAGRATNEGLVVAKVAADEKSAALLEINCETDFVSRNEVFATLADKITKAVLEEDPADDTVLQELEVEGKKITELLSEAIHTIGENIQVSRFKRLATNTGAFASYVHGGGSLGVIVEFGFEKPETAQAEVYKTVCKDIAMQVAAANPGAISQADFSREIIEKEMSIYKAQAAESGKSENIQEHIAAGRMKKFFKENALIEQAFIKDPDTSVETVLKNASKELDDTLSVKSFERFGLGGL